MSIFVTRVSSCRSKLRDCCVSRHVDKIVGVKNYSKTISSRLLSMKSYHLTGTGEKSSTIITTNTKHTIRTDIPIYMGGNDSAPQPVEYLLASFIGCTQATALFVGRHMKPRILIRKMEFDIVGTRDDHGALDNVPISSKSEFPKVPARVTSVDGSITVFASDRKGEAVKIGNDLLKLLEQHTEQRCPVANMILASGCTINITWKDGYNNSTEKN